MDFCKSTSETIKGHIKAWFDEDSDVTISFNSELLREYILIEAQGFQLVYWFSEKDFENWDLKDFLGNMFWSFNKFRKVRDGVWNGQ